MSTKRAVRSGRGDAVDVAGVRLTSPRKVLYRESGVTKLALARYYEAVAARMLPHLAGRPLTLVRCPAGRGRCFYQKHIGEGVPDDVRRVEIEERSGAAVYGVVDCVGGLIALVQLGVLEIHTWGCRRDRLERPDRLTVDLDPDPSVGWPETVRAAELVRDVLARIGLRSFAKVTGGKGIHVVVPVERRVGWEEAKAFARGVCALVAGEMPDRFTLDVSKAERRGRILLDYLRNARGSTAVEVYSTRAREGAPVALPVTWDELGPAGPSPWSLEAAAERAAGDPWAGYFETRQRLTARMIRAVASA